MGDEWEPTQEQVDEVWGNCPEELRPIVGSILQYTHNNPRVAGIEPARCRDLRPTEQDVVNAMESWLDGKWHWEARKEFMEILETINAIRPDGPAADIRMTRSECLALWLGESPITNVDLTRAVQLLDAGVLAPDPDPVMTEVEIAAKAIHAVNVIQGDWITEQSKELYREMATAAIEAIKGDGK